MEEGVNLMTNAVTSLITVAGDVLTMITSNDGLAVYFFAGIVFAGVGLIKAIK